ncbi:MAG: GntR family transcriptional regulator, partial [Woeseiaceae bacterium]
SGFIAFVLSFRFRTENKYIKYLSNILHLSEMKELTFNIRPLNEVLEASNLRGQGSLVDQVYGLLRAQIINLSLPPESALVEQEVASVLEISKTPVREAIIRLAREGLVEVVPKSGSYVTAVSLERYLEACFVRTQLEAGCVKRLAVQGVSMADQVRLKAILTEQEEALEQNDDVRFFELDERLHRCFFDLAGLSGAWEIMNFAKAEMDRVRHLKRLFGIRRRESVVEEHAALVNAIFDRDPDGAEQSMMDHVGTVEDEMNSISDNPLLLRTIEDLNKLVALDRRTPGSKKIA